MSVHYYLRVVLLALLGDALEVLLERDLAVLLLGLGRQHVHHRVVLAWWSVEQQQNTYPPLCQSVGLVLLMWSVRQPSLQLLHAG